MRDTISLLLFIRKKNNVSFDGTFTCTNIFSRAHWHRTYFMYYICISLMADCKIYEQFSYSLVRHLHGEVPTLKVSLSIYMRSVAKQSSPVDRLAFHIPWTQIAPIPIVFLPEEPVNCLNNRVHPLNRFSSAEVFRKVFSLAVMWPVLLF